ncbi:molybdenum cofactor biosynthesis protein MoaE [Sphingomonas sp.]|uniref:molybdenum cofactor biosynthesis protein MoaE n=1 Tax=Sphingomonas sp. TaxID=28214 RepID=UPI00286A0B7A|nr:molybdenum cofactor biosynthesis protein MoaE [Sphingomonas sp.]
MIHVTAEAINPAALLAAFSAANPHAGAIASFLGKVRGDGVEALDLDHHPTFTAAMIERIAADARARFAIADCLIVHRVGRLLPGAPIVLVAAASSHRRAAFDAVDYLMDRLKTEAPLWKREVRADGTQWIEARPSDLADRARWDEGGDHADR